MPQNYFNLNCRAVLLAAIASAYPVIGYSAPAAQVDFAVGNVTAVGANGQTRNLGKGAQIEQGDTVNTNGGRAQLRFTDGAYVSLQPESQFRIDQYRYDGKQDGNEKGFFSLLKGGLRTITGLVGRTNKANYQVQTSVATIGIRGTEYTIEYGHSVIGTVGEGQIEVCNGGGCLSVTNGESYYVQGQEVKPVLTNKRTDLPAPPPQNPPPAFKQAENVNDVGIQCDLVGCAPAPTGLLNGTITPAHVAMIGQISVSDGDGGTFPDSQFVNGTETTATLVGGVLNSYVPDSSSHLVTLINPVTLKNDGIIAWGTASSLTGGESSWDPFSTIHWAVGAPVPDMNAVANMVGSYSLLGATAPTSVSDGKPAGTLDVATMTYDFSNAFGTLSMEWTLRGQPKITAVSSVSGSGSTFTTFIPQSGSATVSAQGFFAGANAVRAGLVYRVDVNNLEESFIGAAALTQKSLTPSVR